MRKEFLGYQRDFGAAVANWLTSTFQNDSHLDLSNVLIAVPASSARRQLLTSLVGITEESNLSYLPPEIVTAGTLPESLYRPNKPFASDDTQLFTWASVLQSFHEQGRLHPIVPKAPDQPPLSFWLDLATRIGRLHRELAGDQIDFKLVRDHCAEQGLESEAVRWDTLTDLQINYLETLNSLELWDKQTARLFAAQHHEEPEASPAIILAGTVDLTRTLRSLLSHVPDVCALIMANEDSSEFFDDTGNLSTDRPFPTPQIPASKITFSNDIADTTRQVVSRISEFDGKYNSDELLIAFPNEQDVPFVQSELKRCKTPNHFPIAGRVNESAPFQLVKLAISFSIAQRYATIAELVRHYHLQKTLESRLDNPHMDSLLDDYYQKYLPLEISTTTVSSRKDPNVYAIVAFIEQLISPVSSATSIEDATSSILTLLNHVYGGLSPSDVTATELHSLSTVATVLDSLSASIERLNLQVEVADFLDAFLDQWGSAEASSTSANGIDLRGWLEVPFHSADAIAVFGANEGVLPRLISGDPFLPDSLRTELGVEDNERRRSRDAYYLTSLLASREDVHFFVPTTNSTGDSLLPSSLLLGGNPKDVAKRILRFDDGEPAVVSLPGDLATTTTHAVPFPSKSAGHPNSLGVSHFRNYLSCPYRYYLRHVLQLRAIDDEADELSGMDFGNLVHDLLDPLIDEPAGSSTCEDTIFKYLSAQLYKHINNTFGSNPMPAIQMQAIAIELRLRKFAEWQADWISQGWEIRRTEWSVTDAILPDCEPELTLRGRIDRLDYNPRTGTWMVFDYKTGDTAIERRNIFSKGEWTDLQLPMYRHLVHDEIGDDPVRLAYVRLSKDLSKPVLFELADDKFDFEAADELARQVAADIRADIFWPPSEFSSRQADDFSWITQDAAFRSTYPPDADLGEKLP